MPVKWKRQRQSRHYQYKHQNDGRSDPAQPQGRGGVLQLSLRFQFAAQILERLKHFAGALVALSLIFAQRVADNVLKLRRSLAVITRKRRRLLLPNRSHDFSWCVADEWRAARHHFVKNYAETPNIGPFIDRGATRLLRRHVRNGSEDRAQVGLNQQERFVFRHRYWQFLFGKLCNPKVEHFHISIRPEHNVPRVDVAMDNARFMGGGECARHLDRNINSVTDLDSPARQTLTQCLAFDQFTGDVMS